MADTETTTTETQQTTDATQTTTGEAQRTAAPDTVTLSAAEAAKLQEAAATLAKYEAERKAAQEADAKKRGEFEGLLKQREAELAEAQRLAQRTASDLAIIEAHEGFRKSEARVVLRALWEATPEKDRAPTPEAQAQRWAKDPTKAPAALQAYLTPPSQQVSTGTRTISSAQAGTDEGAALQWARERRLFVGDASNLSPTRKTALVQAYQKHKSKAG